MKLDDIREVAVIGAGQMGSGIAQVFAASGYAVKIFDAFEGAAEKGLCSIEKLLERQVSKEKISATDKSDTMARLETVVSLGDLSNSDLLIEAIIENFETKAETFKELDSICKPSTIFASNTSSISITRLAASTQRPEQFVGMHFMNPVPVMKLVELIRGLQTSDETYSITREVTERIGKTPVTAQRDFPGFIVNRILVPMINEAIYVLMEGIGTPEEIDTAMKLGTNQPMGPLQLADFVGLDTLLYILNVLHSELGEDKYRPCPLLVKYVEAGWYGKKAGRGFYQYNS